MLMKKWFGILVKKLKIKNIFIMVVYEYCWKCEVECNIIC